MYISLNTHSEREPFNRPTDVAITRTGEMYVSDGYGNSKVHKCSRGDEHKLLGKSYKVGLEPFV